MKYKLLNFTICQIFVVMGMSVSCVKCQEQKMPAAQNVTQFDRSFEKVLSRRKRFLVWRPGSNVLLTASLVKPLAFPRPGGHNLILEWDIFYPLPDSWRVPKKPTKAPPPAPETTTKAPEVSDDHDHSDHDHSGEIWMPSSGWVSDVIQTLSGADAKPADKRNWKPPQKYKPNEWNGNNLFGSLSPSLPISQYRNPLLYHQPWQQTPQKMPFVSNEEININPQYYQSNRRQSPASSSSSYSERNFMANNKQRQMNFMPKGRSQEQRADKKSMESTNDNWRHHYAHRDRRDLYQRLETSSPFNSFDIKGCLLRTICEAQNFLHPPGYSLLQDMLRLVFTVPIKDDMDDDYSIAMRGKHQDCVSVYSERCPMSILAFLLQSKH